MAQEKNITTFAGATGFFLAGHLFFACLFLVGGSEARAEDLAGAELSGEVIHVSQSDCDRLAIHPPGGADYIPGIAADGRAVAPADVDGGFNAGGLSLHSFDIVVNPLAGHGLPPLRGMRGEMRVAHVTIDPDTDRTLINGQEVGGGAHAIAEACDRLYYNRVK